MDHFRIADHSDLKDIVKVLYDSARVYVRWMCIASPGHFDKLPGRVYDDIRPLQRNLVIAASGYPARASRREV